MAVPIAARAGQLAHHPGAGAAVAVIEVSGIWAAIAGLAWMLRVLALTGCGRWGARTRRRVRNAGRRRERSA